MASNIFSNSHKYIYFWKYFKNDYTIFCFYVYSNNCICTFITYDGTNFIAQN
ncbi:hypothetical protein GLOIN_2v1672130 [Rhizophagus irregularis DAOM 181602=DAOM 197198]|uniref:Uncharacterized protein n=1 Tax=Rhizophagus irregularis (strain DAOM 181602 / DAOM 197198 / MUCL 43194) TaxID=747089 RepID=A0A2P4PHD1_RHIID|nr:hypothetical protein GLOIN_2v1672130 [Rhizophagus irregularis DAOM 181602=DAOM 197198]POG64791.1 hypothetical protein GLOIN_2v1672130 [Rhizophagus irregularis DAOM 181602=DAOM 197198]|eukprot:XP_025171657.1 hypothetical protein GLOIN_2v1672130 [Rhizophagus irregularis DAOM 181602=DAOM 197198]